MRFVPAPSSMVGMASEPLPVTVVLAPHRSVLHRGGAARLLGLDPATALAVDDLPGPLAAMLDELDAPTDREELIARAVVRGAGRAPAEELLDGLVAVGAVIDAAGPARVARHRTGAAVVVRGDGPLAVGVAVGLGLAGVDAVHVVAAGAVLGVDVGTGYRDADRGRPRAAAAADAVHRVAPACRTNPPARRTVPDLVVLADALAVEAELSRDLVTSGVGHLQVRVRDGRGVVGPLVLPGRSACLHCLDLHRVERDPAWPAVVAQLVGRSGRADPHTVLGTAALGTAQALAALDGPAVATGEPPALDATLELDAAAATVVRRPWSPHPACWCGAAGPAPRTAVGIRAAEAACAPTASRETING